MRRIIRLATLIIGISLPAATCSDSGGSVAPGAGVTRTLLTDDPFPYYRVARVDLFIVSVSASIAPDTAGSANGFVTLATPNRSVNVLALQNGLTDELGTADLRSGAITAVRLVIDTDRSSITLKNGAVLTGNTHPGIAWQIQRRPAGAQRDQFRADAGTRHGSDGGSRCRCRQDVHALPVPRLD